MMIGGSWLWLSQWVRRWLTLRLHRDKIIYEDGRPYLMARLTRADQAVIFSLHLFFLGGIAASIVLPFVVLFKLVYG